MRKLLALALLVLALGGGLAAGTWMLAQPVQACGASGC